jgi:hypothetical protein
MPPRLRAGGGGGGGGEQRPGKPLFTGLARFGVGKLRLSAQDPFHTLLNLPWWKFIIIFFSTYVLQVWVLCVRCWSAEGVSPRHQRNARGGSARHGTRQSHPATTSCTCTPHAHLLHLHIPRLRPAPATPTPTPAL